MKKALIIANGDVPEKNKIEYLQRIGYRKIICADGGANSARKLNIIPDAIIGDLDSISEENKKYFIDKTKIIHYARQDDTDVEKSIKYLIKKKYKKIILLGATGNRLDHTFCNIAIVMKYFKKINIFILHKKSFLIGYNDDVTLKTKKGEPFSVYAFSKKTKIKSKGLKYPLKNFPLVFGERDSTSNEAVGSEVKLKINNGIILVIRSYKTMRDNGFIY
ncbi:MAG: thiamine diphosphokinase [Ignavibacteriae bacterium]|nr:MAG: thiamine diphosphokinase [Ignavibacteriota bacterium]